MATETWVINETLLNNFTTGAYSNLAATESIFDTKQATSANFPFTSMGKNYVAFQFHPKKGFVPEPVIGDTVLRDGVWTDQAYRTITFEKAPTGNLLTWLQANATKQESTSKVSVDLTTLSGWQSLSSGSHNITIVAKADGYRDSEPSAAVTVTKESTVYNLTLPDIGAGGLLHNEVISPSGMTPYTTNNNANIIQVSEKTYNTVTQYNDDKVPLSIQQFASAYNVVLPDTVESITEAGYRVTFADGTPIEEQPIRLKIEAIQGSEAVTVLRLNWKTDELEVFDITLDNSDTGEITINAGSDYLLIFCRKIEDPLATTDCITFTGESSDFTLSVGGEQEWDGTVEYSTDHENWTEWDGSEISSSGQKLYLRGSGNTTFYKAEIGVMFRLSERAACSGNIQTLLEYSNPPTNIPSIYCYAYMFADCENLTQAPDLPATTLASDCYSNMFAGCTSLTQAPVLPATNLASDCYYSMFNGCTSLTAAPALPATTLANYCYTRMFNGCTSLTAAPALPATILANNCCDCMFCGCTSLKISETQSTEYPTPWRIPSSGTISTEAVEWNLDMLYLTGGTFTSNPSINKTYYGAWTK